MHVIYFFNTALSLRVNTVFLSGSPLSNEITQSMDSEAMNETVPYIFIVLCIVFFFVFFFIIFIM